MNLDGVLRLARAGQLYPAVILHGGSEPIRREAAVDLARVLLCEADAERRPCLECKHCRRIDWQDDHRELFHPDFSVLERDLKTVTSVDATKEFLRQAQVTPFESRGQVFVIANAETLGGGAANALLKILEEPPEQAPRHFILLAPSQFDLLPTVRSRSLPVFLGVAEVPDGERIAEISQQFAQRLGEFATSNDPMHLLVAAEALAAAGDFKDARSAQPWTTAAAAVRASLDDLPATIDRRRVLALAEHLLEGWRMRIRGIQAQRILDGLVVRDLSSAAR